MDYRSLTSLLLRLTGVFIAVSAIAAVPRTFLSVYAKRGVTDPDLAALLLSVMAAGFPTVIGLLLIYFPATVTNRILPADEGKSIDIPQLGQLAFSVLGLYFIATALFDGVYWLAKLRIYSLVYAEINYGQPLRLIATDFAGVASTLAEFLAGLYLLFGGRGLANLVLRLRGRPTPRAAR